MMKFNPENHIGREGYVKIDKGLYAFGKIVETGFSGMAGYYALLQCYNSKGNQMKICLSDIRELIKNKPNGKIIGKVA